MSTTSSKRRKTTAATTNIRINDLPDGILTNVAKYLATPSVVMFATAITQDGASSKTSKAIISAATSIPNNNNEQKQQLQILDFGDIDKSLAAKMTDEHITNILKCIDAPNNLKTLKLASCVNITGSCLDIIRSSVILERLDLSLVGKQESPVLDPEPLLSEPVVIPILEDIIGIGRNLRLLHLPKKLRVSHSPEMNRLVERYNSHISFVGNNCSVCQELCINTGARMWMIRHTGGSSDMDRAQNYTCSICLGHFCSGRDCKDEEGNRFIEWCDRCEKHYCKECVPSNECGICDNYFCNKCDAFDTVCEEEDCDRALCNECILKCRCRYCDQTKCDGCTRNHQCWRNGCNKVICSECVESKGEGGMCDECFDAFCSSDCQYLRCSEDWGNACSKCIQSTATYFRSKCQEYKKENEELCQGMDDLYKKYMNVEKEAE